MPLSPKICPTTPWKEKKKNHCNLQMKGPFARFWLHWIRNKVECVFFLSFSFYYSVLNGKFLFAKCIHIWSSIIPSLLIPELAMQLAYYILATSICLQMCYFFLPSFDNHLDGSMGHSQTIHQVPSNWTVLWNLSGCSFCCSIACILVVGASVTFHASGCNGRSMVRLPHWHEK